MSTAVGALVGAGQSAGQVVGFVTSTIASGKFSDRSIQAIQTLVETVGDAKNRLSQADVKSLRSLFTVDPQKLKEFAIGTSLTISLLGATEYLKAQSLQQLVVNSAGSACLTECLALNFIATLLMTGGDSLVGNAALNTLKSVGTALGNVFSKDNIKGSTEGKEIIGEDKGNESSVKKTTDNFVQRSYAILKNDLAEVPRSIVIGSIGAAILLAGGKLGGTSLSSSFISLIRGKILA